MLTFEPMKRAALLEVVDGFWMQLMAGDVVADAGNAPIAMPAIDSTPTAVATNLVRMFMATSVRRRVSDPLAGDSAIDQTAVPGQESSLRPAFPVDRMVDQVDPQNAADHLGAVRGHAVVRLSLADRGAGGGGAGTDVDVRANEARGVVGGRRWVLDAVDGR